jgi:hypothetical protein
MGDLCTAYTVSIRADGRVEYDGNGSVGPRGTRVKMVAPESARALFERAEKGGFWVWDKSYVLPELTDGDTVTVRIGSRVKKVRDFPDCHRLLSGTTKEPQTPAALCDLESAIKDVAGVTKSFQCIDDAGAGTP